VGIYLLTAGGYLSNGDEETMYRVTRNLAWGQKLTIGRKALTLPAQHVGFLPAEDFCFLPPRCRVSMTPFFPNTCRAYQL
jgi:hypothetical protein